MRGLALLFVAGCVRFDAQPVAVDATRGDDTALTTDAPSGCTLGAWGAPRHLTGVNSTADEGGPALSADKLTLYFESSRSGNLDLYRATRTTTQADFTEITALTGLNSGSAERDPNLSADGLTLYFTSDRNGPGVLYRATRNSLVQEFATASKVTELASFSLSGPTVRSDGGELFVSDLSGTVLGRSTYAPNQGFSTVLSITLLDIGIANASPSLSGDGLTLYYQHKGGPTDPFRIHAATRPDLNSDFGSVASITAFDDTRDTINPEISRDGNTMVFASNRTGGSGGYDLYIADRVCE